MEKRKEKKEKTFLNFMKPFVCMWEKKKVDWQEVNLAHAFGNGHTMLNTPVLVWSLKLSNIGPG